VSKTRIYFEKMNKLTRHIHQLFLNFGFQGWPESTACFRPDTAKMQKQMHEPF